MLKTCESLIIYPFKHPDGIEVKIIKKVISGNTISLKVIRESDVSPQHFNWYIMNLKDFKRIKE